MHGDLRSIGTGNQGNYWNFGGYLYLDKMFNPVLGLELKVNYNQIAGGAQYFSDIYNVVYVDNTRINDDLFFEGEAYGVELNFMISLSNLYNANRGRWDLSGYFGMGYHQYDSRLWWSHHFCFHEQWSSAGEYQLQCEPLWRLRPVG